MVNVDIDFEKYNLYIDGVQVNKTPRVIKPHETNKKSKHPIIIKIIVGPVCNFKCKYCCQNNKEKTKSLNIEELLTRLDNTVQYDKLREVQIWGGEPLMYINDVIQICEHFKKLKTSLSIITNGSLLTEEIIDILNSYNTTICLSHDGPAQKRVRGVDPLDIHRDIIKNIKNLTIECCLTKDNFDVCEINDWFYDKFKELEVTDKNLVVKYNEVEVHDEQTKKFAITDLVKYQLCLRLFFERCKARDPKILWNTFYHGISEGSVAKMCQDIVKSEPVFDCTPCCIESDEILTVDYNGYVRECQNLNDTYNIGLLENLPGKKYVRDSRCENCRYKNLCKSVCPIIPKEYFNINCSMVMARYEVVADFGLKIITKEVIDIASNHKYC